MVHSTDWIPSFIPVRSAVFICWLTSALVLSSGCFQSFGQPPDSECVTDLDCAEGQLCAASGVCICGDGPCECGPLSCSGCCDGDLCVDETTDDACGNDGGNCRDCASIGWRCVVGECVEPELCDPECQAGFTCDETGRCVCDVTDCDGCCSQDMSDCLDICPADQECRDRMCVYPCGVPCTFGTICGDEGECVCDPGTCTGCCSGSSCFSGDSESACGRDGEECWDCAAFDMSCFEGACGLDPACGDECPDGTRCVAGVGCRCDSTICEGCCSEDRLTCYSGEDDASCGADGGVCDRCGVGESCTDGSCLCTPTRCRTSGGCCTTDMSECRRSCADDEICRGGLCTASCADGACAAGYLCIRDYCAEFCSGDSDCPDGFECFVDVCVQNCVEGCETGDPFCYMGVAYECTERRLGCFFPTLRERCPDDEWCIEGGCYAHCGDIICAIGEICLEGACVFPCDRHSDCPSETPVCHDSVCECDTSVCEPTGAPGCLTDNRRYTCRYEHPGDACRTPITETCTRTSECEPAGGECSNVDTYCIDGSCDLSATWGPDSAEITDDGGVVTSCVISPSPEYVVEDVVMGDIDGDGDPELVSAAHEYLSVYFPNDVFCEFLGGYGGEPGLRIVAMLLVDLDEDGVLEIVIGGSDASGTTMRYLSLDSTDDFWSLIPYVVSPWSDGTVIEHLELHPDERMIRGCEGDRIRCYCMTLEGAVVDVCPAG